MGIDIGFDLFPPLENNEYDNSKWTSFINKIETLYENDQKVVCMSNKITFEVGEHPTLPYKGYLFRRFSSKINRQLGEAEPYIKHVYSLAKLDFEHRIHYWSTYGFEEEPNPIYTWTEVYDIEKKEADQPKNDKKSAKSPYPDIRDGNATIVEKSFTKSFYVPSARK
jgi:hypothetical protein